MGRDAMFFIVYWNAGMVASFEIGGYNGVLRVAR
jgi:hypothetical protein